jgi:hypothetical protein
MHRPPVESYLVKIAMMDGQRPIPPSDDKSNQCIRISIGEAYPFYRPNQQTLQIQLRTINSTMVQPVGLRTLRVMMLRCCQMS